MKGLKFGVKALGFRVPSLWFGEVLEAGSFTSTLSPKAQVCNAQDLLGG